MKVALCTGALVHWCTVHRCTERGEHTDQSKK